MTLPVYRRNVNLCDRGFLFSSLLSSGSSTDAGGIIMSGRAPSKWGSSNQSTWASGSDQFIFFFLWYQPLLGALVSASALLHGS